MLLARESRPDVTFTQHPGIQHGDLKGATTEEGSNDQSKLPNAIAGIYSSAKKSDFCSKHGSKVKMTCVITCVLTLRVL